MRPVCVGCGKHPDEIDEYILASSSNQTPDEYVIENEGTYNPKNGHFLCTLDYVEAGCPTSPSGWRAP